MNMLNKLLPLVSLLFIASTSVHAETTYEWSGRIDYVSLQKGELIVRDRGLVLSTGYKVYNRKNKPVSAFNLRKGKRVKLLVDTKTSKVIRVDILD